MAYSPERPPLRIGSQGPMNQGPTAAFLAFNKSIATELQVRLSAPPTSRPPLKGSDQQDAIWEALAQSKSHLVVRALAGTGKTTTGLEGLARAKFPPGNIKAATFHSVSYSACLNQWPFLRQMQPDPDKTWKMLPDGMPSTTKRLIVRLIGICKNTLCDGTIRSEVLDLCTQYDINLFEEEFSNTSDTVLDWLPDILQRSKTPTPSTGIDFDDMIWLPVIWSLPLKKFDLLIVDESQDLNKVQQELCFMLARRIMVVGDEHQAIYGFRGADTKSIANLITRLAASPQGVLELPLTVTRRCPQLVTTLARQIVPSFECLPDAPLGTVCVGSGYHAFEVDGTLTSTSVKVIPYPPTIKRIPVPEDMRRDDPDAPEYFEIEEEGSCPNSTPERGDLILCRTNAPLVELAYSLIRAQVPCKIQGRDIGAGLASLIKKLVPDSSPTTQLITKLNVWSDKEKAKISASAGNSERADAQLQALQDKVDCILALSENIDTVSEILQRIQVLFSDTNKTDPDRSRFVLLSSVHRAKGLEAHTVRIIRPELLPHPAAKLPWQKEQESNLKYVAITRSLHTLHIH